MNLFYQIDFQIIENQLEEFFKNLNLDYSTLSLLSENLKNKIEEEENSNQILKNLENINENISNNLDVITKEIKKAKNDIFKITKNKIENMNKDSKTIVLEIIKDFERTFSSCEEKFNLLLKKLNDSKEEKRLKTDERESKIIDENHRLNTEIRNYLSILQQKETEFIAIKEIKLKESNLREEMESLLKIEKEINYDLNTKIEDYQFFIKKLIKEKEEIEKILTEKEKELNQKCNDIESIQENLEKMKLMNEYKEKFETLNKKYELECEIKMDLQKIIDQQNENYNNIKNSLDEKIEEINKINIIKIDLLAENDLYKKTNQLNQENIENLLKVNNENKDNYNNMEIELMRIKEEIENHSKIKKENESLKLENESIKGIKKEYENLNNDFNKEKFKNEELIKLLSRKNIKLEGFEDMIQKIEEENQELITNQENSNLLKFEIHQVEEFSMVNDSHKETKKEEKEELTIINDIINIIRGDVDKEFSDKKDELKVKNENKIMIILKKYFEKNQIKKEEGEEIIKSNIQEINQTKKVEDFNIIDKKEIENIHISYTEETIKLKEDYNNQIKKIVENYENKINEVIYDDEIKKNQIKKLENSFNDIKIEINEREIQVEKKEQEIKEIKQKLILSEEEYENKIKEITDNFNIKIQEKEKKLKDIIFENENIITDLRKEIQIKKQDENIIKEKFLNDLEILNKEFENKLELSQDKINNLESDLEKLKEEKNRENQIIIENKNFILDFKKIIRNYKSTLKQFILIFLDDEIFIDIISDYFKEDVDNYLLNLNLNAFLAEIEKESNNLFEKVYNLIKFIRPKIIFSFVKIICEFLEDRNLQKHFRSSLESKLEAFKIPKKNLPFFSSENNFFDEYIKLNFENSGMNEENQEIKNKTKEKFNKISNEEINLETLKKIENEISSFNEIKKFEYLNILPEIILNLQFGWEFQKILTESYNIEIVELKNQNKSAKITLEESKKYEAHKYETLKTSINKLQEENKDYSENEKILKSKLNKIQTEIVEIKSEKDKILEKLKSLNKIYEDISIEKRDLIERNVNLVQQMDNFKIENIEIVEKISKNEKIIKNLKDKNEILLKEKEELMKQINEIRYLNDLIADKNQEILIKENELEKIRLAYSELERFIESLKLEKEISQNQHKNKIENLLSELEYSKKLLNLQEEKLKYEKDNSSEDLNRQIVDLKMENNYLKDQKDKMKKYSEDILNKIKSDIKEKEFLIDKRMISHIIIKYFDKYTNDKIKISLLDTLANFIGFSNEERMQIGLSTVGTSTNSNNKNNDKLKSLSDELYNFILNS